MPHVIGKPTIYPAGRQSEKSDVIKTTVKNQIKGKDFFTNSATMGKDQMKTSVKKFGR